VKVLFPIVLLLFLLISASHAIEPAKPYSKQIKMNNAAPARSAATQSQIASKMRALGFKVVKMENVGGNKWQVRVAGWDPMDAQPSYQNTLKWDPSIKNPSKGRGSVTWDPMDKAPSKKNDSANWDPMDKNASINNNSANWDPMDKDASHGASIRSATVNVEYSAGNLALSKGSLRSLGIVQGRSNLPQGMQMR